MRDIQEPPIRLYLVWSNEHDAWWGPNRRGYHHDVWQAGRYTETEAADICRKAAYGWRGGSPPPEVMVLAPENDQDKFSADDLRHMAERMASRAAEATEDANAKRRRCRAGQRGVPMSDLPCWEALYEPGNVSSYFIGYLNDEASAKGAAEAWLRSWSEVVGEFRWDEFQLDPDRFGYDVEYLLREVADDGTDTESGVRVQRRADQSGEAS